MGMVAIHAASLDVAEGVGTGSTTGTDTATLCRMQLTAAERAARFDGFAVSNHGEERHIAGVGYMVPDEGWVLRPVGDGCNLSLIVDAATVDFTVTGAGLNSHWIGHLRASFIQTYSG